MRDTNHGKGRASSRGAGSRSVRTGHDLSAVGLIDLRLDDAVSVVDIGAGERGVE